MDRFEVAAGRSYVWGAAAAKVPTSYLRDAAAAEALYLPATAGRSYVARSRESKHVFPCLQRLWARDLPFGFAGVSLRSSGGSAGGSASWP